MRERWLNREVREREGINIKRGRRRESFHKDMVTMGEDVWREGGTRRRC